MREELCPGCGAPITPGDWLTAVWVTAAGRRAHLGCLDVGLWRDLIPDRIPGYRPGDEWVFYLARSTTSPAWLQPHAAFIALLGDSVVIAVPRREADAQEASLRWRGLSDGVRYCSWAEVRRGWAGTPAEDRLPF